MPRSSKNGKVASRSGKTTLEEVKSAVPRDEQVRFSISLEVGMAVRGRAVAKGYGISVPDMIRVAVAKFIEAREKEVAA